LYEQGIEFCNFANLTEGQTHRDARRCFFLLFFSFYEMW